MPDSVDNLILDLLEWVDRSDRTYTETMDAWRTSCPRFPVWEDANERGLIETVRASGDPVVRLTRKGSSLLRSTRPDSYGKT